MMKRKAGRVERSAKAAPVKRQRKTGRQSGGRSSGASRTRSGTSSPEEWFVNWIRGGAASSAGIVVSASRAMQDIVTMQCVSIRSQDLAKLPVHVWRAKTGGGQEIAADHPLERLLRKPNKWQTWFEFCEQLQVAYLLKSNAYAPIERDGRAVPQALIPIGLEQPVSLCADHDANLYYEITRTNEWERALLKSFPARIPAADVVHLRWLSFDGLSGLSRLGLMKNAIGLNLALEEHSSKLFANGARPGGTLETEHKLSDVAFARIKSQWQEKYAGAENAGKTALLEEGLKFNIGQMTSVESETVDARRAQMEQIATGFDVPMHRLGIIPDGGGAAIIQAHQMYLNNTLSSDAERWEVKLNDMFGLDGEEEFVQFDLDYFNRADIQTRLNAYGTAVTRSIYTVNEARRREGLPDDPEGNVIFQPANMVPLGTKPAAKPAEDPAGPGSDTTGSPAPGGDGDPATTPDKN